jgi:hypothetical protein
VAPELERLRRGDRLRRGGARQRDAGISTFGYFAPRSRQYSLTDVTVERSVAHSNLGIAGKGLDSGSGIQLGGVLRGVVRSSEAYGNGASNDAADGPGGIMVWDSPR